MAVAMIVAMVEAILTRLPGHHLTRFIIVTVLTLCILGIGRCTSWMINYALWLHIMQICRFYLCKSFMHYATLPPGWPTGGAWLIPSWPSSFISVVRSLDSGCNTLGKKGRDIFSIFLIVAIFFSQRTKRCPRTWSLPQRWAGLDRCETDPFLLTAPVASLWDFYFIFYFFFFFFCFGHIVVHKLSFCTTVTS